jgi:hypothetical protein
MIVLRWAALSRFAQIGCIAAATSGCAWFGMAEPENVTGHSVPAVSYGNGYAVVKLSPQPELPAANGGKAIARVKVKPALILKPGQEPVVAMQEPPAANAPEEQAYQPGWSIENKPRTAGMTYNGVRLDPGGMINPNLLQQAIARIGREQGAQDAERIAVVDFSLPADTPRWFFVDLKSGAVTSKYVSHGHAKRLCRKGGCPTTVQAGFSLQTPAVSAEANTDATSVGLYQVVGMRDGGGKFIGPKVVLNGLDPSNATAMRRGIIIHQNPRYFDPKRRLFGRSQGCFVFGPDDLPLVVQALTPGSFIYAGLPGGRATASAPLRGKIKTRLN